MARQNSQEYFALWLHENMPYLAHLFDFDRGVYISDVVEEYLSTASHGQRIMARFAVGVWRGDNRFNFDFIEAASYLDRQQIKIVVDFMQDPFWP